MIRAQGILDKINRQIIDEQDTERVLNVLRSGFMSKPEGGPNVAEFQKQMGAAHSKKYVFAVNSGTSSLHCAMVAIGLQPGDEVIVPALANVADYSVVIQQGATPVFADIDADDFNIDPASIESRITDHTKAIIVVHMYGQPAKIDELRRIADAHKLVLVEDCAQAAGARYKGKYVGSFGDISCFSTYQTKHIISGEGGVVATNDQKYARIISSIANNGVMKEDLDAYDYDRIGYNYQMSELQAAVAIGQLKKLDGRNEQRRKNVEKYKRLLKDLPVTFQAVNEDTENVYFYLTVMLPESFHGKRDDFFNLARKSVPIKKLYPLALTELTLTKDTVEQNCPVAQKLSKRLFNVYVNPGLDDEDINFMADGIKRAYAETENN